MQVDSPEAFVAVTSPTITYKKQAQWWLDISHRRGASK
jgi:hypothetical protein